MVKWPAESLKFLQPVDQQVEVKRGQLKINILLFFHGFHDGELLSRGSDKTLMVKWPAKSLNLDSWLGLSKVS